ncbi:hypothetical protein KIN20_035282 [Parelaphostrongylus tenuis]|uniref:Uncharacterized protein n=1 Tax=Parelaphostrongylus tenuis TaxID=148309 RepID=A0AAD5WKB3_PARTN|nr:hypothetical protein KIN20_035282 [Parelaphostrongylus tenuis]
MDQGGFHNVASSAGSTVTGICTATMGGEKDYYELSLWHNWSKAMWQNVLSKGVRMLASGPFGSHFFSASGTVDGS